MRVNDSTGNRVVYEWDAEEVDADGEVVDHNFTTTLREALAVTPEPGNTISVVLVRDTPEDRAWAYLKDGKLPTHFADAWGKPTYAVPKRFLK